VNIKKLIRQDIAQMKEFFPKLLLMNNDGKAPSFRGELDICDMAGEYWDTFKMKIAAPVNYPYGVPLLQELDGKIDRIADRHISPNGFCCVAIDHILLNHAAKCLSIMEYVRQYAYPYFANQLYFKQEGHYAAKEYKHAFDGVKQFYHESLNIRDTKSAMDILTGIIINKLPSRNQVCLCGSNKKFKDCHLKTVEFLNRLGKKQLEEDLSNFSLFQRVTEV